MENNQSQVAPHVNRPRPFVLVILDGFGIAEKNSANAIAQAKTPNIDTFVREYTAKAIQASGESVGLPMGEMGNSETGHLNLGAGKIVYQDLPRINRAILDKSFFKSKALLDSIDRAKKNSKSLHLMGLVSSGGVHSYLEHLYALLELCKQKDIAQVYIHAFLDGRDTPFNSARGFIESLETRLASLGVGQVATIAGRFYAMDRDNHWERIEKSYNAMVKGDSENKALSAIEAIDSWYAKKVYDEEIPPTVIEKSGAPITTIEDGDSVVFFNFRPDRARELTKAFVLPSLESFTRQSLQNIFFVTMTEYEAKLPVEIAFPPEFIECPLSCLISKAGLKQLHIAETEKYAHVTYFMNGGKETPFSGEKHELIPSPRIASYAEKPEMSAYEITKQIEQAIQAGTYDVIITNFANPDMVAHTGDMKATIKAVEVVDECLGRIFHALGPSGAMLVTADHGNAELMFDVQTGHMNKQHTASPIPVLIVGENYKNPDSLRELYELVPSGVLADIAPTVLSLLRIPQPPEMTGEALI